MPYHPQHTSESVGGNTILTPMLSEETLPSYSPVGPPSAFTETHGPVREHFCYLLDRTHRPWITLKLKKSRAHLPRLLPVYFQTDKIEGDVDVNLKGNQHIENISVCIIGSLSTLGLSYNARSTFFEMSNVIWTGGGESVLEGKHSFPFSITFPDEFSPMIKGFEKRLSAALPPSFNEPDIKADVKYEILVRVRRAGIRPMSKVGMDFVYIPVKRPPPASPLRQVAYRNWTSLVGVEGDPEGWHTVEPVIIKGNLFGDHQVEVQCTLSLAKPLCYTRGTVIPCIIEIQTEDPQALDLLSVPSSIDVQLTRTAFTTKYVGSGDKSSIGHAVFWDSSEGTPGAQKRVIMGEIPLPERMVSSTIMGHLKVSYFVEMFAMRAAGFDLTSDPHSPLVSEAVEIVTALGEGPKPRMYSPPVYE